MEETAHRRVFSCIESHFEGFTEDLREYCRVATISAEGEGFKEGANATRRLLEEYSIDAKEMSVPAGPNLVLGEAGGQEGPILLLYNHYDVQPVDPIEEWDSDPFDPVVREGNLYARGVADTKGNVLAQAAAQDAIREVIGHLPLRLRFMIEGEEEVASPH
ncbi:MAG: M20/M25/M40 family metallo-hydrolase, partial [Candidatus Thermoplasmatota archaeon]|nr:M20/M25/M40 family metallo-hydrolase [Candidatus Thermoplasmatota archaeon]